MGLFGGIDLHSNNGYYGIVDEKGKRVFKRRLLNEPKKILFALEPFREDLVGVAVESTYNWYWLVDCLMEAGYKMHLANPAGIEQYNGLKYTDDKHDAFFLAELLRLGILKEGHIYPKEERPVRDLLRRRLKLVRQRTSHILSFQSLLKRHTGAFMKSNHVKSLPEEEVDVILEEEHLVLSGKTNIAIIRFLTEKILEMEKAVEKKVELKSAYKNIRTVPGIGLILSLTIMLETGNIGRFPGAGNFASYCRCVKSKRVSNNKKKGENNRKNGNKYLAWAFVEAANHHIRSCPEGKSYFQRKMAKTNRAVATKALASKLAKACYFIIRDKDVFKKERIFG
jgi:transposase